MPSPTFLMSPPRRDWELQGRQNFKAREADRVDADRARDEWERLADAIVEAGGDVLVLPPNPRRHLTGLLYTAEAGEFFHDESGDACFLLPNMAVEHRRDEADWIGGFAEGLGFRTVPVEARWEAQGDAIRAADPTRIVHTCGTGPDARTEQDAYGEVADRLSREHLQIQFRADPWFHGNTFLNVYRRRSEEDWRGLALLAPDALQEGEDERLEEFLGDVEILEIDREDSLGYATNSLQVDRTILAPTGLSEGIYEAFDEFGFEVRKLELDELFAKGGGAPVCLTNRLWGLEAESLPDRVRWSCRPEIRQHTSQ